MLYNKLAFKTGDFPDTSNNLAVHGYIMGDPPGELRHPSTLPQICSDFQRDSVGTPRLSTGYYLGVIKLRQRIN